MASNNNQVEDAVGIARHKLVDLLNKKPTLRPAFLRLAFSDAIAHNRRTKGHGPKGSIRFARGAANAHVQLQDAIRELETLKKEDPTVNSYVSYADLYQLAGVEAIKCFGMDIKFHHGREDSGSSVPLDEFPPIDKGDDATAVRSVFYRCGFNDQEIVALSSVITYWMNPKMFDGTTTIEHWDLSIIYKILVNEKEKQDKEKEKRASGPLAPQTTSTTSKSEPTESQSNIQKTTSSKNIQDSKPTPTTNKSEAPSQSNIPGTTSTKNAQDTITSASNAIPNLLYWKCLISDASFYKHVALFAQDRQQFSKVYVSAHEKLSELGFRQFPNPVEPLEHRDMQGIAIAVVVTILVGFLGFFYEVMRT